MSDRPEPQIFTKHRVGDKEYISVQGPWLETASVAFGFMKAIGYEFAEQAIVGKEIRLTAANGEATYRVDSLDPLTTVCEMSLIKGETWEIDEEGNRK